MNHLNKLKKKHKAGRKLSASEFFAEYEIDLESEFQNRLTILQNAIHEEDLDLMNKLLKMRKDSKTLKADPNGRDNTKRQWTPLIHAITQLGTNSSPIVNRLLKVPRHTSNPNITRPAQTQT